MMGETANIQVTDVPYAHIIILPHHLDYNKKRASYSEENTVSRVEEVNEKDLDKYLRLAVDNNYPHRPSALAVMLVEISKSGRVEFVDYSKVSKNKAFVESASQSLSLEVFMSRIIEIASYAKYAKK
jgi:hypothetical protein